MYTDSPLRFSGCDESLEMNGFSPRLVWLTWHELFIWRKDSPLEGCLRQVDRVPCLACKRFSAFPIETYEKSVLPG